MIASRCGLVLRQFPKLTVNRLKSHRDAQRAAGNRQEQNLYSPAQSVCSIHRWVALCRFDRACYKSKIDGH